MHPQLKELLRTLVQLPEEEQGKKAEAILEELKWDVLFAEPASQRFLSAMAEKVRQQHEAGQMKDLETVLDEIEGES